jgi:hypothetical protein
MYSKNFPLISISNIIYNIIIVDCVPRFCKTNTFPIIYYYLIYHSYMLLRSPRPNPALVLHFMCPNGIVVDVIKETKKTKYVRIHEYTRMNRHLLDKYVYSYT